MTLLSVDAGLEFEQYRDVGRWGVQDLGLGGYDLDAALVENDLHCLFRQEEYPISFALDQADRFGKLEASQADYAPLTYLKYNLSGDNIDIQDNLPGGEHPQLQNFYPLAYTADRLSVGTQKISIGLLRPRKVSGGRASMGTVESTSLSSESFSAFENNTSPARAR